MHLKGNGVACFACVTHVTGPDLTSLFCTTQGSSCGCRSSTCLRSGVAPSQQSKDQVGQSTVLNGVKADAYCLCEIRKLHLYTYTCTHARTHARAHSGTCTRTRTQTHIHPPTHPPDPHPPAHTNRFYFHASEVRHWLQMMQASKPSGNQGEGSDSSFSLAGLPSQAALPAARQAESYTVFETIGTLLCA